MASDGIGFVGLGNIGRPMMVNSLNPINENPPGEIPGASRHVLLRMRYSVLRFPPKPPTILPEPPYSE